MKRLILLSYLFIVIGGSFSKGSTPPDIIDKDRFLETVNRYRASVGAPPLRLDPVLDKAAQIQADYNYRHKKEEGNGLHENREIGDVESRVKRAGLGAYIQSYGEICIAMRELGGVPLKQMASPYADIETKLFYLYKGSPSHDEQMRDKSYTRIGIYTIHDGNYLFNTVVFTSETGYPSVVPKKR